MRIMNRDCRLKIEVGGKLINLQSSIVNGLRNWGTDL